MYWASSSDTGIWERLTKKLLYPRENSHSEMKALKYPSSGWETERWRLNREGVMHQDRNLREEERSQVTENTMSHIENSDLFSQNQHEKKKDSCEQQNTVYLFLQDDFEKRKRKAKRLCA